jgi:hypothetical protein
MASESASVNIQEPGGQALFHGGLRLKTDVVVVLEDGGSVAMVLAATPPVTLNGEGGLREQVAPATWLVSQLRATESGMLFTGVTVSWVVPVCPAVMLTPGGLTAKVKSGKLTVKRAEACADAKLVSPG